MAKRLRIKLPVSWSDCSEDNEGAPTYVRVLSDNPGALQVSWAEYTGGVVPNPSAEDLVKMSRELGESQKAGELIESGAGTCDFGELGMAIFRSLEQRIQIWILSNGRDFITVTHIGPREPNLDELLEAQEIVNKLMLSEGKPKWKFW